MSLEQAKQFVEQAVQSLQSGQFQQALDLLDQAIALNPSDSETQVLRGIALSQLAQPEAATDAFRKAIMISPYNVKAYYNLAVHNFSQGDKVGAEQMAREAVRIDPKHAGAKDLLARIAAERAPQTNIQPSAPPGTSGPDPLAPSQPAPPSMGDSPEQPSTPREVPSGMNPPTMSPPPTSPYGTPGNQPYYRPGYQEPSNSISFIANMGKKWDQVGVAVALFSFVVSIVSFVRSFGQISEMFSNPAAMQAAQNATNPFAMTSPADSALSMISLFLTLFCFVWMILDITNRRGNWLWLLPFILCCCCGLHGPIMLIYIWKGRD